MLRFRVNFAAYCAQTKLHFSCQAVFQVRQQLLHAFYGRVTCRRPTTADAPEGRVGSSNATPRPVPTPAGLLQICRGARRRRSIGRHVCDEPTDERRRAHAQAQAPPRSALLSPLSPLSRPQKPPQQRRSPPHQALARSVATMQCSEGETEIRLRNQSDQPVVARRKRPMCLTIAFSCLL